ncbi:MFS general substrate transporter [Exidia glandulosa HHB12029]|uniref:MFS general substrate transporter n=1 Tax=Exidia glandulosa HHB12029 TaxID=1314781 RepID=A0A165IVR9_EXIGL|nr:MFS general substrate transporter [Exidia glandulosa HHB12029]
MITGTVIYVFGLFMLSLADPAQYYQVFLSQGVTCGLGLGLVFLPTLGVISHHFLRRRALAVGIAFTGSSVGGVVFTLMLNNLFRSDSLGFANGVRVAAGVAALPMIVANLIMRTDVPPRRKRTVQVPLPNPASFFRDRDYVLGLLGLCSLSFAVYFPIFYIQIDAAVHGINSDLSFYTLTILNACSIPGRLLPNFAADRLGILNVTIFVALASGAVTLGMLGIQTNSAATAAVIIISVAYGFFSGALLSLLGAVVPTLSRSVHEIGMRTGIVFLFMGICGLFGSPIAGWLLGSNPLTYTWWRAIVFSSVMLFVSAALLFFARLDVVRRKSSRYV